MKKKTIALLLVMMMVFGVTVGGTIAYLTDSEKVVNTFTVGDVQIKLDEAKVGADGKAADKSDRTAEINEEGFTNKYHLIPAGQYDKDPTVTVLEGSEESYIRMIVTITKADASDAIFAANGYNLEEVFGGYDSSKWTCVKNEKVNDVRTYEFRYYKTVAAPADDDANNDTSVKLEPLFETITIPGSVTNAQLEQVSGMTITVEAHAIQAAGFNGDVDAAWAGFDGQ